MNTSSLTPGLQTLDKTELAQILHKSPITIQADASRNPALLPPRLAIPGSSRLLWRRETVEKWLKTHEAKRTTQGRKTQ